MIKLTDQVKFLKGMIKKTEREKAVAIMCKAENTFLYDYQIKYFTENLQVISNLCNDKTLQFKHCENCGEIYLVKRAKQRACSDKCRQSLHRNKTN